jgi:hypothetical protein
VERADPASTTATLRGMLRSEGADMNVKFIGDYVPAADRPPAFVAKGTTSKGHDDLRLSHADRRVGPAGDYPDMLVIVPSS